MTTSASLTMLRDALVAAWNRMSKSDQEVVTPCLERLNKPSAFDGFDYDRIVFEFSLEELRALHAGLTLAYRREDQTNHFSDRSRFLEARVAQLPDLDNLIDTIGGLSQPIYL